MGVNIQWPISKLIIAGEKTIETRTYQLPERYVGKQLVFIETPGAKGVFKARIKGLITFKQSFKYSSMNDFYSDFERHKVSADSIWKWQETKGKWGWPIAKFEPCRTEVSAPKNRGIVFSKIPVELMLGTGLSHLDFI